MSTRSLRPLIDHLRRAVGQSGDGVLTDAQLLERWVRRRDQGAFELLLWRHGPMVLCVCRRLLRQRADADDAFQATFLVLVRKAGSIRRREALGAWLHRVACRVAMRLRSEAARRTTREQTLVEAPAALDSEGTDTRELRAVVDEEIDRLPPRYRRALVLCCLEGKTQEEAARLLSCPRGTVSSWLTRARDRLRRNLLRRGVVVPAVGLTAALATDVSAGTLTPLLVPLLRGMAAGRVVSVDMMSSQTIALAEGMLRTMLMTKVKMAAALLLLGVLFAAGIGSFTRPTRAADAAATPQEKEAPRFFAGSFSSTRGFASRDMADGIAWGKEAHGLQAGLAIRPGDDPRCVSGESITFVVYLRNAGTKEVRLTHSEELFLEWWMMPVVKDEHGIRLVVDMGSVSLAESPLVRRTIKPGQQITLGYPWFRIRPVDWDGEARRPTCRAFPGRYKVSYAKIHLRLDGDDTDVSPSTGDVEFDIHGGDARSDARPAVEATRGPSVAQMLKFKPRQEGVVYTVPVADQLTGCKVELVKQGTKSGWALKDGEGKTLRLFLDTNGDDRIDMWAYYKDGVEVYAEIDTTFSGKPDQFHWFRERPSPELSSPEYQEQPKDQETIPVGSRHFQLPIRIDPNLKPKVREVSLLVSSDGGRSYRKVKRALPTAKGFDYQAPDDGLYQFVIQTVDEDGRTMPPDPIRARPTIVVCVDTTPPTARLAADHRDDGGYFLSWKISDANLDRWSLRLEYRMPGKPEWSKVDVQPGNQGIVPLAETFRGAEFRLRVCDKAGNETTTVLSLKPEKEQARPLILPRRAGEIPRREGTSRRGEGFHPSISSGREGKASRRD